MNNQTITSEYLELQKKLHQDTNYGVASLKFAPLVASIANQFRVQTISDYGAGKKRLLEGLHQAGFVPADYRPYDPVFPEYGAPMSADLVCCIDTLEHIEPRFIDNVIKDLAGITTNLGFFSIHMGPAGKTLEDGRNAHLIQQPSSWWLEKLIKYFEIVHLQSHKTMGDGIWMIVRPKLVSVQERETVYSRAS